MRILVTTTICLAVSSLLLTTAVGQKRDTKSSFVKDYVAGTHQSPLYGTFYYKCWLAPDLSGDPNELEWLWSVTWKPTTSEGRRLLSRAYNIMRRYEGLKISGNTAKAKADALMFWAGMYCSRPGNDDSYTNTNKKSDMVGWLYLDKFTLDKSGKPVSASFFGSPYGHKHPLSVLSHQPFIPFSVCFSIMPYILADLLSDRYKSTFNIVDDLQAGVLFSCDFGDDGAFFVMLDKPAGSSPSDLYKAKVVFIPAKITGFDTLKELRESTVIRLEFMDSDGFLVGSLIIAPFEWTVLAYKGKPRYLTYDAYQVAIFGKATKFAIRYGVLKK
jgi:hypothetical protein